MINIPTN
ncbi:hypothetical protein D039_0183A, partial [Vibrio parahaemolyticus EKP-028]